MLRGFAVNPTRVSSGYRGAHRVGRVVSRHRSHLRTLAGVDSQVTGHYFLGRSTSGLPKA